MSNKTTRMGSGDIDWSGDTSVPTKYSHLPASEARERIKQDEEKAKQLKIAHMKKVEDAKIAKAVEDAKKEWMSESKEIVNDKVESVVSETAIDATLFESTELAKISNAIFMLAGKANVEVGKISEDGISLTIDGVSILISKTT